MNNQYVKNKAVVDAWRAPVPGGWCSVGAATASEHRIVSTLALEDYVFAGVGGYKGTAHQRDISNLWLIVDLGTGDVMLGSVPSVTADSVPALGYLPADFQEVVDWARMVANLTQG